MRKAPQFFLLFLVICDSILPLRVNQLRNSIPSSSARKTELSAGPLHSLRVAPLEAQIASLYF